MGARLALAGVSLHLTLLTCGVGVRLEVRSPSHCPILRSGLIRCRRRGLGSCSGVHRGLMPSYGCHWASETPHPTAHHTCMSRQALAVEGIGQQVAGCCAGGVAGLIQTLVQVPLTVQTRESCRPGTVEASRPEGAGSVVVTGLGLTCAEFL